MFLRESNRSTALKTLTLRLRGAKVELEEAGLETENMAESTSTLQTKLKALTHGKVDIMADADTFKNTTQILREMSAAWEDMTDIERAAALELMGGKRQANILSSVIKNFDTVEDVIATSMDSSGSALAENAKWLDSIEGKTYQLTNALETMWSHLIDSDMAKGFIEFLTTTVKFLDTLPGKASAVAAIGLALMKWKNISLPALGKDAYKSLENLGAAQTKINALKAQGVTPATDNINQYANAVAGLTAKQQANMLASAGLDKAQIKLAMATNNLNHETIESATAHIHSKNAQMEDQQAVRRLTELKIQQIAATIREKGYTNELAIAKLFSARASDMVSKEAAEEIINTSTLTQEQKELAMQYYETATAQNGLKNSWAGLKNASPLSTFSMIAMIIPTLVSWTKELIDTTEELKESYDELQSSISSIEGEIDTLDTELSDIQEKIDALSNKNLTFSEAQELQKLKEQSAELEAQKELQEKILAAREDQNKVKSLSMINNLLKTTAANQERNAETGKKWGQVLLGIGGAITGIALAAHSAGTSLSLTTAGMAAITGAMAGSSVGGAIGEGIGGLSTTDSLIEWYESYEKAIAAAEQKAADAESKYLSDMTDGNYEKWQKKVEAVNTLQTEMYDGLTELQGYISNLEYDDSTKDIIDGYNDLMAHIDVKSMGGNIDAQINSIESLKDEYYALSRGVDEHGNNIALTAEEYARYQSIVAQVLGYNVGLTESFTENGSAIYDAQGNLVSYNAILEETIRLMREQQQEAARFAIEGKNEDDNPLWKAYKSARKNYNKQNKKIVFDDTYIDYSDFNSDYRFDDSGMNEIIADVIGIERGAFETFPEYYAKNIDAILNPSNLNKIYEKYRSEHYFVDEEDLDKMLDGFTKYLSDIDSQPDRAASALNKFKQTLMTIPQMSDYYYGTNGAEQMSGNSIDFINKYISSIELTNDMSKKEITKLKDDILEFTNKIGEDQELQDSINDFYKIDPNKVPVNKYSQELKNLTQQLLDKGVITKDDINSDGIANMLSDMFLDGRTIEEMQTKIKEKLKVSSQGLVNSLSVEELKVAYKILPEIQDGLTFEELRKEIKDRLPEATGPIVQTYSTLTSQVEQLNEVISQTSEIVLNNTKVTQEYKDSLVALGISEEELAECFDATNGLVVTNAKKLNELINSSKKTTAQNAQLAKSQARLQYYELYKKMAALVDANGNITSSNVGVILSYYEEMNALEKTIARYSMLEAKLLGTANAYEKFQDAQDIDSQTNYIGSAEEMISALGEAFNTAKLGTETAQAAIEGLVPESVYKDLDGVDEKMDAIYSYFKEGKLAQYFDIVFDDEGNIESAEMKLGNLRKFIEDGLDGTTESGTKIFEGTDWMHFQLSDSWLESLQEGTDRLEALAKEMGVTKDVAFAFLKSLEDRDIEWLNGDYSTFFDQMLSGTNEGKIQLYTEKLADITAEKAKLVAEEAKLTKQLQDGSITQEEYDAKIAELSKKQEEYNTKLSEYNTQLATAKNASKQAIFGVGQDGKTDYQIKTSSEVAATDNMDELDNWIERNEKVSQLYEKQADAHEKYVTALENDDANNADSVQALKDAENEYNNITNTLADAIKKRDEFAEPTVLEIEVALDDIETKIESTRKTLDEKLTDGSHLITVEIDGKKVEKSITSTEDLLANCFHIDEDGYWTINAGVNKSELEQKYPEIVGYVNLLNSQTTLTASLNGTDVEVTLETLSGQIEEIITLLDGIKISLDEQSKTTFQKDVQGLLDSLGPLGRVIKIGYNWVTGEYNTGTEGNVGVNGTAHASGSWGLPTSEKDSLVGELGPEMVVDPSSGRYYTVGDNGAEMVDLPKGAIIFNHKQTEGLLKNGYVTSRGKAYAEGNAHLTIYPQASSQTQWDGTGYSSWDDPTYELADALDSAADSVNEFEETIDWIEYRMQELDSALGLYSAHLENASSYSEQNSLIDNMIKVNKDIYSNALAGAEYYQNKANTYLSGLTSELITAAKNGAIAITDFTQEQDEATVKAIQNYRDFAQKSTDLTKQAVETIAEIRALAIQKIDNIYDFGSAKTAIEDAQTEKLKNRVELDETRGLITAAAYYDAMIENSGKKIEYWTPILADMQAKFDEAVSSGAITKFSKEWYENLQKLYDTQAEIDSARIELEEYQNAINDIGWDNFDYLIKQFKYIQDETKNVIDLMSDDDMVTTPETDDGWTANQVEWTKEGIATIGLYAQQMQNAEVVAKRYAKAIEKLDADYKSGKYSESEYLEKLNELKDAQYDSIKAYKDAQKAIVELNKTRVEHIKEGIEKEIDAYQKLLDAKKKELDAEKDLYDFQKSTTEKQKNIAAIERRLAALANDTSMSAATQRKKLEAELAEAQYELQDTYYSRSVEDKKTALDKELEAFQKEKEDEITKWEEYLDNVEQVVADSLGVVQAGATSVYDTLNTKASEYGITLSDSIKSPWLDGADAIGSYTEAFGDSYGSTMSMLNDIIAKWQEVIDKKAKAGAQDVSSINSANSAYTNASYTAPVTSTPAATNTTTQKPQQETKPSLTKGSYVEVKSGTRWYADSYGGGAWGYAKSGTIKYVNASGTHAYNIDGLGWVKKTDIKGYAKGTTKLNKSGIVNVDELGEELILGAHNGRLTYLERDSGVIPADLTSNLMAWGELDPQYMIERNRPVVAPHNSIVNNTVELNMNIAEVVHVDHVDNNNIPDLTKAVQKQLDSYMSKVNSAIKAKVR